VSLVEFGGVAGRPARVRRLNLWLVPRRVVESEVCKVLVFFQLCMLALLQV
jgi:hypothetical protein